MKKPTCDCYGENIEFEDFYSTAYVRFIDGDGDCIYAEDKDINFCPGCGKPMQEVE